MGSCNFEQRVGWWEHGWKTQVPTGVSTAQNVLNLRYSLFELVPLLINLALSLKRAGGTHGHLVGLIKLLTTTTDARTTVRLRWCLNYHSLAIGYTYRLSAGQRDCPVTGHSSPPLSCNTMATECLITVSRCDNTIIFFSTVSNQGSNNPSTTYSSIPVANQSKVFQRCRGFQQERVTFWRYHY